MQPGLPLTNTTLKVVIRKIFMKSYSVFDDMIMDFFSLSKIAIHIQ